MTSRWKKFIVIIVGSLVIAFLAGPPMAFAYKFPKAFMAHENHGSKKGFCALKYIFNKDKLDRNEALLVNKAEIEICRSIFFDHNESMNAPPFDAVQIFPPLRC